MTIFESLDALDGAPLDESALQGRAVLVVNVASRCGLTPQYTGLERLQERYGERGFTVLGVPCNQFGEQEPGSAEEIQTFCSTTYGVSFPMTEKLDVNGPERHPLYGTLTVTPDAGGRGGRRAVELREVPRLRRRTRGGALSPDGRAGVAGADRRRSSRSSSPDGRDTCFERTFRGRTVRAHDDRAPRAGRARCADRREVLRHLMCL